MRVHLVEESRLSLGGRFKSQRTRSKLVPRVSRVVLRLRATVQATRGGKVPRECRRFHLVRKWQPLDSLRLSWFTRCLSTGLSAPFASMVEPPHGCMIQLMRTTLDFADEVHDIRTRLVSEG